MSTLTALGLANLIFVAVFTWCACIRASGEGQSPRSAILEAWINIVIGFGVNFTANMLILPFVGAHPSAAQNFWMGWIYTAISLVRQYAIRRWFNARLQAVATALAGGA